MRAITVGSHRQRATSFCSRRRRSRAGVRTSMGPRPNVSWQYRSNSGNRSPPIRTMSPLRARRRNRYSRGRSTGPWNSSISRWSSRRSLGPSQSPADTFGPKAEVAARSGSRASNFVARAAILPRSLPDILDVRPTIGRGDVFTGSAGLEMSLSTRQSYLSEWVRPLQGLGCLIGTTGDHSSAPA